MAESCCTTSLSNIQSLLSTLTHVTKVSTQAIIWYFGNNPGTEEFVYEVNLPEAVESNELESFFIHTLVKTRDVRNGHEVMVKENVAVAQSYLVSGQKSGQCQTVMPTLTQTKAWVNAQLQQTPPVDLDSLVARWNISALTLAKDLERNISTATTTLPLLTVDLALAKNDLKELKELEESTRNHSKNDAFDRLSLADKIRRRMLAAREALRDAENWTLLAQDMDPLFESKDFAKAALRLSEATRSLALLQGTPEYEDRRSMLHQLQNQLESAVSPSLANAFANKDIKTVIELKLVFEQINRSTDFAAAYFKATKAPLLVLWRELVGSLPIMEPDGNLKTATAITANVNDASVFLLSLQKFLDAFLSVLRHELDWAKELFPGNAVANMVKLIHQTFNSLKPSLRFSLDRLKTNQKNSFVLIISQCFRACVSWCTTVEIELASHSNIIPAPQSTASQHIVVKKPSSTQLLVPAPLIQSKFDMAGWAYPILETFSPYHQTYAKLESSYLSSTLPGIFSSPRYLPPTMTSLGKLTLTLDVLVDHVLPSVFESLQTACARTVDFTAGFGFEGYIEAADLFLVNVVKRVEGVVFDLNALSGSENSAAPAVSGTNVVTFRTSGAKGQENDDDEEYGLTASKLDDGQEWVTFELGIKFLTVIKSIHDGIRGQEANVLKTVMEVSKRLEAGKSVDLASPVSQAILDLSKTPPVFSSKSSLSLLESSSLNTPKLQLLLFSPPLPSPLFTNSAHNLEIITSQTQAVLFQMVFGPIGKHLPESISTLPLWTLDVDPTNIGKSVADIPRFSLSPSVFITRVGESLLTLPQRFDMHLSISTTSNNRNRDDGLGDTLIEAALELGVRGLPNLVPADFIFEDTEAEEVASDQKSRKGLEQDDIIHLWITSLARSCMELVVKLVEAMDVGVVSDLTNVARVLDTHGEEAALKGILEESKEDETNGNIIRKVAKICGVVI
ncbi:Golgi complex component 7-domain-containing protein [Obelidium mucronatum]|nr:Golgi complex component 7-domain-containing protein [Obelidium mucronatum]